MLPKVDTFAKDISEEVKNKEATLADIATASNDVGNTEVKVPVTSRTSTLFIIALTFLVLVVIGLVFIMYKYLSSPEENVQTQATTPTSEVAPQNETQAPKQSSLSTLSKNMDTAIGAYISSVVKKDNGYILSISSYAPVFVYMTKREEFFIDDLVSTLYSESSKTTQTQTKPTNTTTSTSTASTTKQEVASTTKEIPNDDTPIWSNVTISNINIRTYSYQGKTVAYSFISTEKLVIAKTPDEIVAIKSAILR